MKKTSLLIGLSLLVALTMTTDIAAKSKRNSSLKGKEIYIQLYSAREDIKTDFKGTITALGKMGFKGVEAAGYNDGKFYDLSPKAFKKAIEGTGMSVTSSHVGKSLHNDIAKTDWNEIWQWWDVAIQAHKDAGMKFMVMPSMPRLNSLADLKVYCSYFNQIGEKCNAAGLKFGYHNHNFEFETIEGEMMYDYMLKNTDPSKVFFQMDVYWVVRGGASPVEYFNKYPGRFAMLHLKDHKELGKSGMVGFDAIFQQSPIAGVNYLVVEVEHYNFKPLESIALSLQYLLHHPNLKDVYGK